MRLASSGWAVVLGVLMACGGNDGKDPIDDPPEPPSEGPATFTLTLGGEPVSGGIFYVFHNPDGSVITSGNVDEDGSTTATIPKNAMLTFLVAQPQATLGFGAPQNLYTIVGVQPDDTLAFDLLDLTGDGQPPGGSYQAASVTLTGGIEGATRYVLANGCGSTEITDSAATTVLGVDDECVRGGTFSVLAIAYAGNDALAYTFAKNVTAVATNPTFGFPTTAVTLGPWQTNLTDAVVDVTDVPADLQNGQLGFAQFMGGVSMLSDELEPGSNSLQQATAAIDSHGLFGLLFFQNDVSLFIDTKTGLTANRSISLEDSLGGRILGSAISDASDPRPTLSYFSTADQTKVDGGIVCIQYSNFDGKAPAFGSPAMSVVWSFLVPPGTSQFQLPALPAELAAFAPGENTEHVRRVVTQIESSLIDGYPAFRQAGLFAEASPSLDENALGPDTSVKLMQHFQQSNFFPLGNDQGLTTGRPRLGELLLNSCSSLAL